MRGGEEAGQPCGAKAFESQFQWGWIARLATERGRGVETNGQKKSRRGLEFVNAAAQQIAASFEKNEAAALRDGLNEMRDSGMLERLASADPQNGGGAIKNALNLFVRNGMG